MNAKCYSVLKRRHSLAPLQFTEKISIQEEMEEIVECITLLEDDLDNYDSDDEDDEDDINDINDFNDILYGHLGELYARLTVLTVFIDEPVDPIVPRDVVLDTYSEEYCYANFRFSVEQLEELIGEVEDGDDEYNGLLKLNSFYITDNRLKVPGILVVFKKGSDVANFLCTTSSETKTEIEMDKMYT